MLRLHSQRANRPAGSLGARLAPSACSCVRMHARARARSGASCSCAAIEWHRCIAELRQKTTSLGSLAGDRCLDHGAAGTARRNGSESRLLAVQPDCRSVGAHQPHLPQAAKRALLDIMRYRPAGLAFLPPSCCPMMAGAFFSSCLGACALRSSPDTLANPALVRTVCATHTAVLARRPSTAASRSGVAGKRLTGGSLSLACPTATIPALAGMARMPASPRKPAFGSLSDAPSAALSATAAQRVAPTPTERIAAAAA